MVNLERVRDVLRATATERLPDASMLAELRVLFPRTVGAIVSTIKELQWVVCSMEGTLGWGDEDEEGAGSRYAT
jgi:hypothetical protein